MTESPIKLPEEFLKSMKERLGNSVYDFLNVLNNPAPVSIRLNPKKKYQLKGDVVPWSKYGVYLEERPVFTLDPCFHAGAYYVQEASSMFIEQVFVQHNLMSKPLRILDLSAAPGGKSTHMISLAHPDSLIVCNEVIRSRAIILAENLTKWGYPNVVVTNNDPEDFHRLHGFFDVVLVDAPCSGEGLFRKDPHAMQEWSPDNVQLCSKRQRRILNDVWPALKTNGLLIYSTCTYNTLENEDNIQRLSELHAIQSIELQLDKSWNIETTKTKNIVGYRFYPHKVHGEGFFLAAVRKEELQPEVHIKNKKLSGSPAKKVIDQLNDWILKPDEAAYELKNDRVEFCNASLSNISSYLEQHLKVIQTGTRLATIKGEKLIPDHALALSINLNKENFPITELTLEQSLAYLRKDNIDISTPIKGFGLVTYKGLPIGWINALDNRVNNLYPKEWRIRMRS